MEVRPGIIALLYGFVGLVFIAIGIPLARQRVAPNVWYGFRTAKTLGSTKIWYAANRVAGIDLIVSGVALICGVSALYIFRDTIERLFTFHTWTLLLFIVIMLGIAGHGWWSLSRM